VFVPASFNMTTGPAHWELTFRARAIDNQIYMFGISPARNETGYIAYGNSIAVNSWGKVVGRLEEKEGILMLDVDIDDINEVRESLPLLKHRRPDLY
jgi:omega-amidase